MHHSIREGKEFLWAKNLKAQKFRKPRILSTFRKTPKKLILTDGSRLWCNTESYLHDMFPSKIKEVLWVKEDGGLITQRLHNTNKVSWIVELSYWSPSEEAGTLNKWFSKLLGIRRWELRRRKVEMAEVEDCGEWLDHYGIKRPAWMKVLGSKSNQI